MLIAGLSLWGTPYIAYQLSVGRVYDGVSQTISGWAHQFMGPGAGYYRGAMMSPVLPQSPMTRPQLPWGSPAPRTGAAPERNNPQAQVGRIIGVNGANFNSATVGGYNISRDKEQRLDLRH